MTLLAEDLLILLLDDDSGRPLVDSTKLPRVLAGAVLLELAMDGRVSPAAAGESVKTGRLVVRRHEPLADPQLARSADWVATHRPVKAPQAIEKLSKGIKAELLARLLANGWVREDQRRILGLFPSKTWPSRDTAHKAKIREALQSVLVDGLSPQPRTAALISLLSAIDATGKVLPQADRKAIRRRAKEIADGEWAGVAVRKAVEAINAAVTASIVIAATAGAAAGT